MVQCSDLDLVGYEREAGGFDIENTGVLHGAAAWVVQPTRASQSAEELPVVRLRVCGGLSTLNKWVTANRDTGLLSDEHLDRAREYERQRSISCDPPQCVQHP